MTDPLRVVLKDWLQVAAFVLAGLWALWTFWFSEYAKPSSVRGYLQVKTEMSTSGAPQTVKGVLMQPVSVTVQVTNPTKRMLEVSSGYLMVHASGLAIPKEDAFSREKLNSTLNAEKSGRSAFVGPTSRSLIYVAGFFSGWTFAEGEVQQTNRVLWVPVGCFQFLELNAYLLSEVAPAKLQVKQQVNSDVDVDFMVDRGASAPAISAESAEGKKLLSEHGLVDTTTFLTLADAAKPELADFCKKAPSSL